MSQFQQLNDGWNADPNAPEPSARVDGHDLVLTFRVNAIQFPAFREDDTGVLRFLQCRRYRLGPPNDEGWYRGQCRFSRSAPHWGLFYELRGDLCLSQCPNDWIEVYAAGSGSRHFLFYLRDQTFECDAADWCFSVGGDGRQWFLPWGPLVHATPDDGLAKELRSETCQEHVLFNTPLRPIGIRHDCDDVLFELLDGSGRVAVVHLTYAQYPEPDPRWPDTEIFRDWGDFVQKRMQPDHSDWTA